MQLQGLQGKSVANAIVNFPLASVPVETIVDKAFVCSHAEIYDSITTTVSVSTVRNALIVIQGSTIVEIILAQCRAGTGAFHVDGLTRIRTRLNFTPE